MCCSKFVFQFFSFKIRESAINFETKMQTKCGAQRSRSESHQINTGDYNKVTLLNESENVRRGVCVYRM